MRLGRKLVSIDEDKDGVNLLFDDGQSERFDLLVGADGLSSRVRDHVEASHADGEGGGVTPPEYSGIRVQFGVVPAGGARPQGASGEFHQWFGEGVYALTGSYGTGAADPNPDPDPSPDPNPNPNPNLNPNPNPNPNRRCRRRHVRYGRGLGP